MKEFLFTTRHLYAFASVRFVFWLSFSVLAAGIETLAIGLFLPVLVQADTHSPLRELITGTFSKLGIDYSMTVAVVAATGFYALRTCFIAFHEVFAADFVTSAVAWTKDTIAERLFRADYGFITKRGVSDLNNVFTVEFASVSTAFAQYSAIVTNVVFAIVYVGLAMGASPNLAILLIVVFIPAYFLLTRVLEAVRTLSKDTVQANAALQSNLLQSLGSIKYIKATGSSAGVAKLIRHAVSLQRRLYFRQMSLASLVRYAVDFTLAALFAVFLYYNVEVAGGDLVGVLFLVFVLRRAASFAQNVQQTYQQFAGLSGSIRVMQELADDLLTHEERLDAGGVAPDFDGSLRLRRVSVGYGDGDPVLRGVDLTIPARTTCAIVGSSGVGKTTIANLLTGILKPSSGRISLGGADYVGIDLGKLRAGIGYVTQERTTFNDTVTNNISLWRRTAHTDEEVRKVAHLASAAAFIEGLPEGYETRIGDRGRGLSEGQTQRIAIARELFKDPPLLIFDEPTSALDAQSEAAVNGTIEHYRGLKTIVLISHRVGNLKGTDQIIVLRDGRVVERGTYDELCVLGGEFKAMVDQHSSGQIAPENG